MQQLPFACKVAVLEMAELDPRASKNGILRRLTQAVWHRIMELRIAIRAASKAPTVRYRERRAAVWLLPASIASWI